MSDENLQYFFGIDIGTDSVGYAATSKEYDLLKYRGEPVWGVQTFEAASAAEDRRVNRTARRRLDRRQQRVRLINEIFAPAICKNDPNFFIRRKESALFKEDAQHGVHLFEGGISDKQFHKEYPTIHHLIVDLMRSDAPKDVRLVYLACAWLVAKRGHFLFAADAGNVDDFSVPYQEFADICHNDYECGLPWPDATAPDTVLEVMQAELGVTKKTALFVEKVCGGKKPSKKLEEDCPFRKDLIITLLAGGKASMKDLFANEEYGELDSLSLGMDEERFDEILAELGDDGVLLRALRKLYDCALLKKTLRGYTYISDAKIAVYEQHAKDLKWLKQFIRKYKPGDYARVFRRAEAGNYVAYSYNVKNCSAPQEIKKKANKTVFCDYLKKIVEKTDVAPEDQERYDDMMSRLSLYTFLPKQKDTDNRVIPQQLYRCELAQILSQAKRYLPLLTEKDTDGLTNEQKILSVFDFRIPYYVGPLNPASSHAWIVRKAGIIYPWNFEKMVDLDASEQAFINRMTNTCTYLPGEDVLPYCSLLYSRFMVLNEINNLKINQQPIPVEVKQAIYTDLFENGTKKKITKKAVCDYLKSHGYLKPSDEISGVDNTLNANLNSYHCFKRLLESGTLTEEQVESIIDHAAYSEDRLRMSRWLEREYPNLSAADRKYILSLKLKEFGRLSRKLLTGIYGCKKNGTGEALTIMDALWQTNDNLMQLLSENYTFKDQISDFAESYYADPKNKKTLSERLSDMYVSNAVKRPIIRALDIVSDVVKAVGCAPQKIFVEMARGGTPDQKGKRTVTRKQQILDLYKQVKHEDLPKLKQQLEDMGEMANNRLQSDKLFLYYMQLGRCMYSGESIDLSRLTTDTYDIDHIYPQSKVKDDSINNRILVLSSANGVKSDRYPVEASVRAKMGEFWDYLHKNGMISDEKYARLTRTTGFTDDELHQFINRQLVETRQSTKVVAQLLKERYPDTEIVYVKAGMVSEFRQEFEMLKCRTVNDLHHAKDAYLNIVVGNVYHEKFTRRWFDTTQKYNVSVKKTFDREQKPYGNLVWRGAEDLAKVRKVLGKNAVHVTQYAICKHHGQNGGFYDQNPLKARAGLIPRKDGLDTEKYGGYNGLTTTFFTLVSFTNGQKKELMFFPVDLLYCERFVSDPAFATAYVAKTLNEANKKADDIVFPLGSRVLKVNTVLSLDGFLVCLASGSVKDGRVGFLPLTQFVCGYETERYIKRLERVDEKVKAYPRYTASAEYDGVSAEQNAKLFDLYIEKLTDSVFSKRPGVNVAALAEKRDAFLALPLEQQCTSLLKMHMIFARQPNDVDLSDIGLGSRVFKSRKSMYLSGWKKEYGEVRIIDQSASGLFSSQSGNLLDLL